MFGSYAYVRKYLVSRPAGTDPEVASLGPWGERTYPITPLPGFKDLKAYFNMDNGSGKLRGIYADGNFAAVPILREWIAPFASMGMTSVVAKPTDSTDHVGMAELGLPAFQFIQDPLDYGSRVHHTNVDTFDHLRAQDLRQAATIMASLLLTSAESETSIPRNVLPTQPSVTKPFDYEDPDKD